MVTSRVKSLSATLNGFELHFVLGPSYERQAATYRPHTNARNTTANNTKGSQ